MTAGITQTIVAGREDGVPGNCMQAAVATLLGVPLDAVPHFVLFDDWRTATRQWLDERGLVWTCFKPHESGALPDQRCIAAGESPRGVGHVCIVEHGEIAWDPHPSRDGLTVIDELWFFTTPAEVPA